MIPPGWKINNMIVGCEHKIRSACAAEITQKDWCDIWLKAKENALKGRPALLALLLPIVARKIPDNIPEGTPPAAPMTEAERLRLELYHVPAIPGTNGATVHADPHA